MPKVINKYIFDKFNYNLDIYGGDVIITKNIYYPGNKIIYLKKGCIGRLVDTHSTSHIAFDFIYNKKRYEISYLDIIQGNVEIISMLRTEKINKILNE